MRESVAAKAARLVTSGRVRVIRCNEQGIALDVLGDSADLFTQPTPYRVMRNVKNGVLVESCTCENAQAHPIRPRCSHMALARMLWRPRGDRS